MAGSRNKPSADQDVLDHLRRQLAQAVRSDETLCVAFSGGSDSVVLLDALSRLLPPGKLYAHHVHHGLAAEADAWSDFCQNFAAARGVPCQITRVQVDRHTGEGLEAAARRVRYQALGNTSANVLAVAHHRDDQVETILFKLMRGTGVAGLAGMPASRPLSFGGGKRLWRPLLGLPQAALRAYAETNDLQWVTDASNHNTALSRNALRLNCLPGLRAAFPALDVNLSRAAEQAGEALALLVERAEDDLRSLRRTGEQPLDLSALLGLSALRQRNVLRHWLHEAGWPAPERRTLLDLQSQLQNAGQDRHVHWRYPAGNCHVWRGKLYRVPHTQPVPEFVAWSGQTTLAWVGAAVQWTACAGGQTGPDPVGRLAISATRLAAAWSKGIRVGLAGRQGAAQLKLAANRPRRQLKNLLQERGIPPWQRPILPLLWVADELVACPGVGVAADWQPQAGEAYWEMGWDGLA